MRLLREYISVKIKSEGLGEEKDFFSGSKFSDGVKEWYVEDVLEYVQENHERYFRGDFPVSELVHNLRWWQGDESRALRADTRYPLLVLIENGEYNVCDGLNRLWKIVNVEGKDLTDIYLVPKEDIERLGFKAK
jgi:hypothetical protein